MDKDEVILLLKEMESKAKEAKFIADAICKMLNNSDDELYSALNELQGCEITSEEAFEKIQYLFK